MRRQASGSPPPGPGKKPRLDPDSKDIVPTAVKGAAASACSSAAANACSSAGGSDVPAVVEYEAQRRVELVDPELLKTLPMLQCWGCKELVWECRVPPCAHLACKSCLDGFFASCSDEPRPKCPMCKEGFRRSEWEPLDPTKHKLLHRMLSAMKIRCPDYQHMGCKAVLEYSEAQDHLRKTCSWAITTCEFCSRRYRTCDMAAHSKHCKRWITCADCKARHTSDDTTAHALKCPAAVLSCPHNCGARLRRDTLQTHNKTCSHAPVPCPIPFCAAKHVARRHLIVHLKDPALHTPDLLQMFRLPQPTTPPTAHPSPAAPTTPPSAHPTPAATASTTAATTVSGLTTHATTSIIAPTAASAAAGATAATVTTSNSAAAATAAVTWDERNALAELVDIQTMMARGGGRDRLGGGRDGLGGFRVVGAFVASLREAWSLIAQVRQASEGARCSLPVGFCEAKHVMPFRVTPDEGDLIVCISCGRELAPATAHFNCETCRIHVCLRCCVQNAPPLTGAHAAPAPAPAPQAGAPAAAGAAGAAGARRPPRPPAGAMRHTMDLETFLRLLRGP
jgi:hypothetical protein